MNLDLDMLKEMISSTLSELNEPAATTEKEETAAKKAEEAADAAKEAAEEAKDEAEAEKAALKNAEREENGSPEPPEPSTLPESFEITKGRLRQIIAEELISAKKQGIL